MDLSSTSMRSIDWIVVVITLLGAAGLRLTGLNFGQPNSEYNHSLDPMIHVSTPIHPDEYFYVSIPYEMVARGWTYPHFYENPSFLINLNRLTFQLTGLQHNISVVRWDTEHLSNRSFAPFSFYVIGRLYSALGSMIAVAAVYAIVRLMVGHYPALLAGLLTAVSYPLVQHAHYATTSSLASGFVMLCLWGCYIALMRPNKLSWGLVIAGIAAGLAAGSRYNAAAVSISFMMTSVFVLLRSGRWQAFLLVVVSGACFPITFLLTTPGFLGENEFFWEQFHFIYARYGSTGGFVGLVNEYRYIVLLAMGIPATILTIVGLSSSWLRLARRWPEMLHPRIIFPSLILTAFALPYTVVVLNTPAYAIGDQLTVPFVPTLFMWSALGFQIWYQRWGHHRLSTILLLLCFTLLPMLPSVLFVARLNQLDTREQLQAWIYTHIPRGARIHLSGAYNVALDYGDYIVSQDYDYGVSIESLVNENVEYLIVSDARTFFDRRIERPVGDRWPMQDLLLVAEIPRWRWWGDDVAVNNGAYWHQPGLRIYHLPQTTSIR
jgi:hypothetical protein